MKLVLDASVAIKFYAAEAGSDLAVAWLRRDVTLCVPDIFLVEVCQALLRHAREGALSRSDLLGAANDLTGLVEVPFRSEQLIDQAFRIAHTLEHRLHDCMYLALAERLQCPMLTADERLVRKVRGDPSLSMPILRLTDPIS